MRKVPSIKADDCLVQKYVGSAYDNIIEVNKHIPDITEVADNIDAIKEVADNLPIEVPVNKVLPPVAAIAGQTKFNIGKSLQSIQVNRSGTIEQTDQYSYDKNTGIVTLLNDPAQAGEKFQFTYGIPPAQGIEIDGITVKLIDFVHPDDMYIEQAWKRMLEYFGIVSNATSKNMIIKMGGQDWLNKEPMKQFRGMQIDFEGQSITDVATGLTSDTPDGDYWYRRKGVFWSYPDDSIPVRNTFITADVFEGQSSIVVDDVSHTEAGDIIVIDLWDGGFDPNRDYNNVPMEQGWQGNLNGIHPYIQRICKVVEVQPDNNRLVIDYTFGWTVRVSQFPENRRDGKPYKGLRTSIYVDGLWDGTNPQPEENNIINTVRTFKPHELPTGTAIRNFNYICESVSSRAMTAGIMRWAKYDRYFVNWFYSYDTRIEMGMLNKAKLGCFLGVYNSHHSVRDIYASYIIKGLEGGEGYLTNGARGHDHHHENLYQVGGRHVHDSTGGSNMTIRNSWGILDQGGSAAFDTHGRYEHDITYINCKGAICIIGANNRVSFGGATSKIKIDHCYFQKLFGFSENLSIESSEIWDIGDSVPALAPDDLHDRECGLYVGLCRMSNVVGFTMKIASDPRYMTSFDTTSYPGGPQTAKERYDPYINSPRGKDISLDGRIGCYMDSVIYTNGRFSNHWVMDVTGGRSWTATTAAATTTVDFVNNCYLNLDTKFERTQCNITGKTKVIEIDATMSSDYVAATSLTYGITISDLEHWDYDVDKAISISILDTVWNFDDASAKRCFSLSRSNPKVAGNQKVLLSFSNNIQNGSETDSKIYLANIDLAGSMSGNVFKGFSVAAYDAAFGNLTDFPIEFIRRGNSYTGGAISRDSMWREEVDLNLSTMQAFEEIRTTIPTTRRLKPESVVTLRMGYIPPNVIVQAFYDTQTSEWKVKAVNASNSTKFFSNARALIQVEE